MSIIAQIKTALQFAAKAHAGQLRAIGADLGKPYFDTHVLRVVAAVPTWARPAAALHDVLEDTDATMEDLIALGTPTDTLEAVDLLTHRPSDSYDAYVLRIAAAVTAGGRIARAVKLADLADNLATMLDGSSSLRRRYVKAMGQIATQMETLGDTK